jgi:hypothetical protein
MIEFALEESTKVILTVLSTLFTVISDSINILLTVLDVANASHTRV